MFWRRLQNNYLEFIHEESLSGICLLIATGCALFLANSIWSETYVRFLHYSLFIFSLSPNKIFQIDPLFVINDGLMVLFFLTVSLEIKREFLAGELTHWRTALLPALAAMGGMLMPMILFMIINWHSPTTFKGWGIPVATDIAFTLGVLSLLGQRIPLGLKVFLMALAIIDDLGAIVVIAIFYNNEINWLFLIAAGLFWLILCLGNYLRIENNFFYIICGFCLWLCLLPSGIHPTIAGVLLAMTIPLQSPRSKLIIWENTLHPWVAFGIMPVFALVNAGLLFTEVSWQACLHPLPLGIILGLIIGKPVGILLFASIAILFGAASLPTGVNWRHLLGAALLCGIGFTMSLFIGDLAFMNDGVMTGMQIRLGVFAGSFISGILGYLFLKGVA